MKQVTERLPLDEWCGDWLGRGRKKLHGMIEIFDGFTMMVVTGVQKLVHNFKSFGNLFKIPEFRTYPRQLNHNLWRWDTGISSF